MTTAPKIIIINLESSADRRALMTAHLATLGLQGEFFPASDGRQMTDAEIAVEELKQPHTQGFKQLFHQRYDPGKKQQRPTQQILQV